MPSKGKRLRFDTPDPFYQLERAIYRKSGVASFEDTNLALHEADISSLSSIRFEHCWYVAITPVVHPFVHTLLTPQTGLPPAADVIAWLGIRNFRSRHIRSLAESHLPYPGHHAHTENDEIHTDPLKQYIFAKDERIEGWFHPDDQQSRDRSQQSHERLRDLVLERHLYYVLSHTYPQDFDGYICVNYVLLFAVGISAATGHLLGVVTHQACHNLCD